MQVMRQRDAAFPCASAASLPETDAFACGAAVPPFPTTLAGASTDCMFLQKSAGSGGVLEKKGTALEQESPPFLEALLPFNTHSFCATNDRTEAS